MLFDVKAINKRVALIADPRASAADRVATLMHLSDYETRIHCNGSSLLADTALGSASIVFLHIHCEGLDAFESLMYWREHNLNSHLVILIPDGPHPRAITKALMYLGAGAVLKEPFSDDEFRTALRTAVLIRKEG